MVRVEEAEKIILQQCKDFETEIISFDNCLGRVLAENIIADRDLPAFDRVTMDGIAINHEAFRNGERSFKIKATQSAGAVPIDIDADDECIEIMTGAVLPSSADTVIPYEDIIVQDGKATITVSTIRQHQNIHHRGKDKKEQELLVAADARITTAVITV